MNAEAPIETHPHFPQLREWHQGTMGASGRIVFPQKLSREQIRAINERVLAVWRGHGHGGRDADE